MLRGYLGERSVDVSVRLAMRYGQSSPRSWTLKAAAARVSWWLPLYPQYSGHHHGQRGGRRDGLARGAPELPGCGRPFFDDAGYVDALARRVQNTGWPIRPAPVDELSRRAAARGGRGRPVLTNASRPHACGGGWR